jgi:tetratricopeptide (TPR) repeat protein
VAPLSLENAAIVARAAANDASRAAAEAAQRARTAPYGGDPDSVLARATLAASDGAARLAMDSAGTAVDAAAVMEAEATHAPRETVVPTSVREAGERARDAAGRAREAADEAADRPARAAAPVAGDRRGLLAAFRRSMRSQDAFVRGEALYEQRDYRGSRSAFLEAVELDGRHEEAWALLGWSSYFLGDHATATVAFKAGLERQPSWDGLYDGLGWSRLRLGRPHLARDAFRAALDLAPDYPDALHGLGEAYYQLGRYDQAVPPLAAAERRLRPLVGPEPEELRGVRNRLGWSLYQLGRYPEALSTFQRAAQADPTLHEPQVGLGWTYLGLGRKAEARAAFERALRIRPGFTEAVRGLLAAGR